MIGFLGCFIGTTGTKTMLFNEQNDAVGRGYKAYDLFTPFENAYEQNPEDWYLSLKQSIKDAVKDSELEVKALSVSAQGGSFFLADIDENGKVIPLCPALTWMDVRASEEFEEVKQALSVDEVYKTTGWRLSRGSAICRILWLKKHCPDIFAKTKIILSTSDYVYYKLTGKLVIDYTSAAMMANFNVTNKEYDKKILSVLGIDESMLPKLVPTGEDLGEILPEVAKDLGLTAGVKVFAGAHDQYAASLGSNYFSNNDLVISTGTTWVLFGNSAKPVFNQYYLAPCVHPKGGYGVITSAVSSGTVMEWTKNLIGTDFKTLDEQVEKRALDKNLLVYPFISGGGGYRGKQLKYAVKNAEYRHDKFDIARATMEGVAFEIKQIINLFRQSGIKEDKIIVAGGAARSGIWMKILSSVLGKEIYISNQADRCCFGAFSIAKKGYLGGDFVRFEFDGFTIMPEQDKILDYNEKFELYNSQI